jgi:hypothetical protein
MSVRLLNDVSGLGLRGRLRWFGRISSDYKHSVYHYLVSSTNSALITHFLWHLNVRSQNDAPDLRCHGQKF